MTRKEYSGYYCRCVPLHGAITHAWIRQMIRCTNGPDGCTSAPTVTRCLLMGTASSSQRQQCLCFVNTFSRSNKRHATWKEVGGLLMRRGTPGYGVTALTSADMYACFMDLPKGGPPERLRFNILWPVLQRPGLSPKMLAVTHPPVPR